MSLLKDFKPKNTRQRKNESQRRKIDLPEIHSSPKKEIIKDIPEDTKTIMIEKYSYTPEAEEKKPVAQKEQLLESSNCSKVAKPKNSFGFFELSYFCEEHLSIILNSPIELNIKKLHSLNKEFISQKLETISDYKKELTIENFYDTLYYYKNEILFPEEYLELTGFLREYFDIEKVAILYNTGEIIIEETNYCNFWFRDRLNVFFDKNLDLISPEILKEDKCLKCLFNMFCPFKRLQQMSNN
jgi:hypothetical protein